MPSVEELFEDPLYLEWSDELSQEFISIQRRGLQVLAQASFREVWHLSQMFLACIGDRSSWQWS